MIAQPILSASLIHFSLKVKGLVFGTFCVMLQWSSCRETPQSYSVSRWSTGAEEQYGLPGPSAHWPLGCAPPESVGVTLTTSVGVTLTARLLSFHQDTVVGLQALSEFAAEVYSPSLDFTVVTTVTSDPAFRKTFNVNAQNAMVLQQAEVRGCSTRSWNRSVSLYSILCAYSHKHRVQEDRDTRCARSHFILTSVIVLLQISKFGGSLKIDANGHGIGMLQVWTDIRHKPALPYFIPRGSHLVYGLTHTLTHLSTYLLPWVRFRVWC